MEQETEGLCWWMENDDTLQCTDEPAGAAVRRSSNTSADLPTDSSGFTAWWLSCEGERWFASLLWYFQQKQHPTLMQRYRRCRHLRQTCAFVNRLWEEWSPVRQRVSLTSWCAFLRWDRVEETALASAADGCLQGDCSLTLQAGTTWYYSNKDTLSQSETLLFSPPGRSESINNAERLRGLSLPLKAAGLSDQIHFHSQTQLMDGILWRWHWCTESSKGSVKLSFLAFAPVTQEKSIVFFMRFCK